MQKKMGSRRLQSIRSHVGSGSSIICTGPATARAVAATQQHVSSDGSLALPVHRAANVDLVTEQFRSAAPDEREALPAGTRTPDLAYLPEYFS